ncbi:MFS transporter [Blastococcus sp. PRF04-17]|uniref:MFS transporter n=1 Tax=Blastococcus sp. PRF04-17 TaxID=2933797 RepID=UPI001FF6ADFA|nr:MFS transporter [Blastococcus sp. PRF04-17]UOY01757.1 MFS transporter [Blastococcus sp. PRF04-17]
MSDSPVPLPREVAPPPAGRPRLPAWIFVAMVALIGLNLRAAMGSVPPLLPDIAEDLRLSATSQGMLTSVVIIFMGLSAPLGQRLGARLGPERATVVTLLVLAAGCTLRLVAVTEPIFLVSSALAGIGMGGSSALLPSLIAEHVPRIRGLTMGVYSTGLALGVAVAAWVAVPTERALSGWRPALALWGGITALTALLWLALVPRLRARTGPARAAAPVVTNNRLPWRSPTARWVTWFTAANMIIGFSGLAWITPFYVDLGVPGQRAAEYFVLFQVVQLFAMLTLPWLTDFTRDRRLMLALCVACSGIGIVCLLVAPLALAVPAVLVFGFGVGGSSTLGLVLLVDTTRSQADAARLTGMVMLVAFLAGAAGPALLGLMHDLTGSFVAGYATVLVLTALVLLSVPVLRPGRTIDDVPLPAGRAATEPVT